MEEKLHTEEPKRKTAKDFFILFLAIGGLIALLVLLKFVIAKFHLMP